MQVDVLDQSCHDLSPTFFLAKELNVKNVVNVLHEAKFADGDWAQLGLQLIDHFNSATISADHGKASDCMIHMIFQWLRTDTKVSWEKLAAAVTKVKGYGEATAASILQKAGIVHTGMLTVFLASFPGLSTSRFDCCILEVIKTCMVGRPGHKLITIYICKVLLYKETFIFTTATPKKLFFTIIPPTCIRMTHSTP